MSERLWTPPPEWTREKKLATAAAKLAKEAAELEAQAVEVEALRPPPQQPGMKYPLTAAEAWARANRFYEARLPLAKAIFEHRRKVDDLLAELDLALVEAIPDAGKALDAVIAVRRKQLGASGIWPAEGDAPRRGSPQGQLLHNHPDVQSAEASIRVLQAKRVTLSEQRTANLEAAITLQEEIDDLPRLLRRYEAIFKETTVKPQNDDPPHRRPCERPNPFA